MNAGVAPRRVLLTGGSGRLGTELRRLLPGVMSPTRSEMDVTEARQVAAAIDRCRPDVLVHAAAYTDVALAEHERAVCWRVNVEGTRIIARAGVERSIVLVYISTDYVFDGTRGRYAEDDAPGPVRNYYGLTKLVAEEIVRCVPRHLIIRTSFRAREWPHPMAFSDLYTSQDYVDVVAPDIALAVRHCRDLTPGTLHIATERKSAYALARRRRPDVRPASRLDAPVSLPEDCSLDTSRWQAIKRSYSPEGGTSPA